MAGSLLRLSGAPSFRPALVVAVVELGDEVAHIALARMIAELL